MDVLSCHYKHVPHPLQMGTTHTLNMYHTHYKQVPHPLQTGTIPTTNRYLTLHNPPQTGTTPITNSYHTLKQTPELTLGHFKINSHHQFVSGLGPDSSRPTVCL